MDKNIPLHLQEVIFPSSKPEVSRAIDISWFTRIVLQLIFLTTINHTFSQEFPKIGQIWTGSKTSGKILLPPPVGITDEIVFCVEDVEFKGGVSKENKIVGISTTDPHFKINGKTYIGTPLGEFVNKDKVKSVRGWGHYLPIDEEWFAGFDYQTVSDSSKVLFVFKYKFTYWKRYLPVTLMVHSI